jgi:type I restriction enzyme S subunit
LGDLTDLAVVETNSKPAPAGTLLMSLKLSIGQMAFAGRDLFTNEAIEELAQRAAEIRKLCSEMETYAHELLLGAYARIVEGAPVMPFGQVAPLVRRPVKVKPSKEYDELEVRSFGKGTFHKPAISGATVVKKLYRIEAGDLVFNNVFAWEGAVAVARPEDHGRVGSHRFLTCVPQEGLAKSSFLCFHFLTGRGLHNLAKLHPAAPEEIGPATSNCWKS